MITYKGNTTPKVGDDEWYELSSTTLPEDTEIHWRLFREVDGEWIKVDFEDIGRKIRLEFSQKALGERFLLHAYTAKGNRLTSEGLEIIPSKGEAKITDLLIRDSSKKATKETYGFGEQITVCVKAIDMQGKEVTLQIWDKKVGTEAPKEVPLWEGKGKIPLKGVLWFENITLMDVTAMFLGKEKNYYLTLSIDGKIIDAKKNTPLKLKGFQVNKPSLGISPVLVGTPDRDFSLKSEEERETEFTIELLDLKNNPIAKLEDTDDIYYQEEFKITVKPDRKIGKKVLFLNIKDSEGERIANNLEAKWEEKTERFECKYTFPLSAYNEEGEKYVYGKYKTVNNKLKEFELDIENTLKIKNANRKKENKYVIIPFTYKRNYEELLGLYSVKRKINNQELEDKCENHFIKGNYKTLVDGFTKELNKKQDIVDIKKLVAEKASELWQLAVKNKNTLDDRPLYWTRIQMQVILKRHPVFKNDINHNESTVKMGNDLEKIIRIFEENSRNYNLDFSEVSTKKKVLITGFDPFQLDPKNDQNILQSNPSGVVALFFNQEEISDTFIQTMMIPVRYTDFDGTQNPKKGQGEGIIEKYIKPFIESKKADAIITVSQAGEGDYHIDTFAIARRGGFADNMNYTRKKKSKSVSDDSPETIPTTLPESFTKGKSRAIYWNEYYKKGKRFYSGPGGDYLSNEIFYRVAKLRENFKSDIKTGHFHIAMIQKYREDLIPTKIEELIRIVTNTLEEGFKEI
jgi:hypothetical protein